MSSTMTWRAIVAFCAVCTVGLWGCGGSGGGSEYHRVIPDGYREVSFVAEGVGIGGVQSLAALLDASDIGTGSGTTLQGPTSITDTAAVTCTFDAGGASSQTTTETYTVRMSTDSACPNANECITCTITGGGTSACSLACTGVVPSSADSDADTFAVDVTFTSAFNSDMPDPYGTVRFDATTADTDFLLQTETVVLTDCDGVGAEEIGLAAEWTDATWFTDVQGAHRSGYAINDVGEGAGSVNSTCTVTHKFSATANLTTLAGGAGGQLSTNDLGSVVMTSTICDDEDDSAVAYTASVCGIVP